MKLTTPAGGNRCAYCGAPGPLTTEHVIPSFLYRRFPEQKSGYNVRASTFVTWEATVADVCAHCNHGPLSTLDQYAKTFYTENRCHRRFTSAHSITIRYDYDTLLRWLLKVSFNAARSAGRSADPFRPLIPTILHGARPPGTQFLGIEILKDAPLTADERRLLPPEIRHWRRMPAKMFRVSAFGLHPPGCSHPIATGRLVGLDAFYFYVFVLRESLARPARRALAQKIVACLKDCTLLQPGRNEQTLRVSEHTIRDVYAASASALRPDWDAYLARSPAARRRLTGA